MVAPASTMSDCVMQAGARRFAFGHLQRLPADCPRGTLLRTPARLHEEAAGP